MWKLFLSFLTSCLYYSSTDPNIQILPENVTVMENQNVNFSCAINDHSTKITESIKWNKMASPNSITIAAARFSSNCSINLIPNSPGITSCKNKFLYYLTWTNVKKENDKTILMCSMRINGTDVYSNKTLLTVIGQKDQKIKMLPEVVTVLENREVNFSCAINDQSTAIREPMQWSKQADSKNTTIALAAFSNCSSNLNVESPFITSCKNKDLYSLTWRNVTRANHMSTLMCSMHTPGGEVYSNRALVKVVVPVEKITITDDNNSTLIDVNENKTITVQCSTSESIPVPNITCYVQKYNGTNSSYIGTAIHKLKSNNSNFMEAFLQYTSTRRHNNHSIVCKASNTPEVTAVESNRLHLNVKYPPNGPPKLDIDGIEFTVIEHHTVTLTCTSNGGNPRAKLNWTCNDHISKTVNVTTDSEKTQAIIIWNATRQPDTVCYCSSTHDLANMSRTDDVNVTVLYSPKSPTIQLQRNNDTINISGNAKLIEHKSYCLSCSASGNPSPSIYFWTRHHDMNVSNERSYNLPNVDRKQHGTYSCHAQNIMRPSYGATYTGKNNISVEVDILYPPLISKSQDITITEGSSLNFTCPFVPGNPNVTTFKWTRNGDTRKWAVQNLNISNVSRNDKGEYICTVENIMTPSVQHQEKGINNETFYLNVEYAATVEKFFVNGFMEQQNVTVNESSYINFTCNVSGNPISTTDINLYDKGFLISNHSNNLQFPFGPASCHDAGTYNCRGYNKHNRELNSTKSVHVFVNCRPRRNPLIPVRQNTTTTTNVPVHINFTAIAYPKPTYAAWQKYKGSSWTSFDENDNIRISQSALRFSVTILNVSVGDFGQYRIVINNTFGSYEEHFSIIAEDKPNPPIAFSVNEESVTKSSITVQWNPSFNGGLSQTFVVRYSKEGGDWLNVSIEDSGMSSMNYTIRYLSSGTLYQLMIYAENRLGKSPHSDALYMNTKAEEVTTGLDLVGSVTGSLFGIIAVTAGIIVGIFCYRKRGYKSPHVKRPTELVYQNVPFNDFSQKSTQRTNVLNETSFEVLEDVDDVPQMYSEPTEYYNSPDKIENLARIKVTELFSYVLDKSKDSFGMIYQRLPTGLQYPCTFARKPENIAMNRYNGIFPYDHSRVKIYGQPNFFINACYIDGYMKKKEYIASLGPTVKTTDGFKTFWSMVWNEQSDILVMLTNLLEPSGMKCETYWPELNCTRSYGVLEVSCQKVDAFAEYTVRSFTISNALECRSVTLFHYTAWPDKKVPEDVTSLIEFRQRVKATPPSSGPTVVHCSAGIGRTGTFIALDILIKEGQCEGSVDVFECVNSMREQRVKLVQTLEQYVYIYKALVNSLYFDCEAIPIESFQEYVNTTHNNVFSTQFQQLKQSVEADSKDDLDARAENERLVNKNRQAADIPGQKRVYLHLNRTMGDSDYINAVYVNSFRKKDHFIIAQSPLKHTVFDFICMIYQEDCCCVVTMEDLIEPGMNVGIYLPSDGQTLTLGDFKISCTILETKPQYIVRKMRIEKHENGERDAYHFQYNKWLPGSDTPADAKEFVQFISDVEDYADQLGDETSNVLVHCLKANERSALYCVIAILMEKMRFERQVSVLSTVRHLRTRRRSAITNMEQLKFCYQAVNAYISAFEP